MDPFRDLLFDPVAELLMAAALMAVSGLPGLLLKKPAWGQKTAAALLCLAAVPGLTGAGRLLAGMPTTTYILPLPLPFAPFTVSADPLSALFMLPLFLVSACCGVYAVAYRPASEEPAGARKLSLFFGLLPAAMAMVLLARHGVLLLMSWEVMALSAYFLVNTEQRQPAVQRAGTVYLLATHTATMALFVMVALLKRSTGTFDFPGIHALAGDETTAAILLLALVGFGAKAGIMPLHIWLPGAHANAPSHVSAVMSGLMLKMGVYGILRVTAFFGEIPLWFGGLLLGLGAVSALTGISLAGAQRDLKRLLACSSIENVGIICMGAGLAFIGLQTRNPSLAVLGLAGLFMHIINHALFKPLLFLGAGAIIHAAGSREMDRMGGLARRLPWTAPLFLTGALAICGLPPLNGFVGELFLYMAAFGEGTASPFPLLALTGPLLAIIGGIAVMTFVKLYGTVFLGQPRSPRETPHHGESAALVLPMALLAGLCLILGLAAPLELSLVSPVVGQYSGLSAADVGREAAIVPLQALMAVNVSLLLLLLLMAAVYRHRLRRLPLAAAPTWGCGYLAPSPRMQYSATSFSEQAVNLLGVVVSPRRRLPVIEGEFPHRSAFGFEATETILDRLLVPLFHGAGVAFAFLRRLQHGQLHLYVLYIFATLFVLMVWRH